MKKIILITLIFLFSSVLFFGAYRNVKAANNPSQTLQSVLRIEILSAKTMSGTAGDFVTVNAQITNSTNQPINNVTTYLSLVDRQNKLPVDLEDWSAEKGLFIGSIDAGQTLPLNWKIHFVKAGNYSLAVIADIEGQEFPIASSLTYFNVAPKHNLNPGQVLPVALGMPLLILLFLTTINYSRKRG